MGTTTVFVGQRMVVRSALVLTASMVAGSTLIEVVGIAAQSTLDFPGRVEAATTYALSSTLLACAWLTVRGWRPLALLASPLAGLVSWFTIPAVTAEYPVGDLFGTGTLAMFVTAVDVDALEVLVIGVATLTALAWRRLCPSAPLKHVTRANQSHTTSPDVVAHCGSRPGSMILSCRWWLFAVLLGRW